MAKMPTAADVRRVSPSSLPQVRVSDAAAGIDVYRANAERGQTLGQIGKALEQEATKLRDEEDTASAQQAASDQVKEIHLSLYGDPEAGTTGLLGLSGQAAMHALAEHNKKAEDSYQRTLEGLNEGAARKFGPVGAARLATAGEKAAVYVRGERQKFIDAAAVGEIDTIVGEAVADPLNNAQSVTDAVTATKNLYLKNIGNPANAKDPKTKTQLQYGLDQAILKVTTAVHMGAIDTLLQSESATAAEDAEKYFKEHKNGISAVKRDDVMRMLKVQTLQEKELRATDKIMALDGSWSDKHALAMKLPASIRKEVRANLDRERARENVAEADEDDAALARATRAIQDGQTPTNFAKTNPRDFDRVAKHVPTLWSMHAALVQRQTFRQASDFEAFRKFSRLPDEELKRLNIGLVQHLLTVNEAGTLYQLQMGLDKQDKKVKTSPAVTNAGQKILRDLAPNKYYNWAKTATKTQESNARNATLYMSQLIKEHTDLGKTPTRIQYEDMAKLTVRTFSSDPDNTGGLSLVPRPGEGKVEPFAAWDEEALANLSAEQRDDLQATSLQMGVRNEKAYKMFMEMIYAEPNVVYSDELMKRLLGAFYLGNTKVMRELLPESGFAPSPSPPPPPATAPQQSAPGVTESE
jgi:hypothetical protein